MDLEGCKALGLITSTGVVAGARKLGERLCGEVELLLELAQGWQRPRCGLQSAEAVRLCLPSMGFAAPRIVPRVVLGHREDMGEGARHGSVIGFAQNPPQLETLQTLARLLLGVLPQH